MKTAVCTALCSAILIAAMILSTSVLADAPAQKIPTHGGTSMVHSQSGSFTKTVTDTVMLMGPWGSGAFANGQFEDPTGVPAWNGWTSIDLTQPTEVRWHADTFQSLSGTWSAWCGDPDLPVCYNDTLGGYGNNWDEVLEWRSTVADPDQACTIDIAALVQARTEAGYDFCYVTVVTADETIDLWVRDGVNEVEILALQTVYYPENYVGDEGNEVVIQFRVTSDGAYSDEDCFRPTDGAFLLDDLSITLSNGTGYSHDFEDGSLGDLVPVIPLGVGDFAQIWTGLQSQDSCGAVNESPMVAFIDDGEVVPGTGGTPCISWCYGPNGYIVNNSGGLAGPDYHIHNAVESPVMPWPGPGHEGGLLQFDVWRDMTLGSNDPGIFFTWSVRSTVDPDPATITEEPWEDRNFVYYGGPDWLRMAQPVGDLIPPEAQWVQVQLAVYEIGYVWGWYGADGTPAPYFDNVRLVAFPYHGPALSAGVNSLPHDTFPESGMLDTVNLGANNIRFDSGLDISQGWDDPVNDPGDSIVITIEPMRSGATIDDFPRLHWNLKRNPLFDAHRSAGLPDRGWVEGWQATNSQGTPLVDQFVFDLPDSGFLFPGDFLYYYFEATDVVDGVAQTATLPADTTGFSNFDDPMAYLPIFKLHALPTLVEEAPGEYSQPGILFWDDAGAEGNRDEWYTSFRNLGLVAGRDYDIYYTNNPRQGTGQGLGGRATAAQLAGYEDMLYTSGRVTSGTLGFGDIQGDKSRDVQVLTAWLEQGGKDLFMSGDDLAGDLNRADISTITFLQDWLGVDLVDENVLAAINLQTGPLVLSESGNPVLFSLDLWRAVARCTALSQYYGSGSFATGLKRYDGVVSRASAQRLAEFTTPSGAGGAYPFNAATLNLRPEHQARIISLPYDFEGVWNDTSSPNPGAPLASRTLLLQDILTYFDVTGSFQPSPVPQAGILSARVFPNPFNPATTIQWNLPKAGPLNVDVYDLRGRLVSTLVDGAQPAGPGEIRWDGRGQDGRNAATGAYYYRLRSDQGTLTGKMTLLK